MGDLSKNFSRSEFVCKCGCGFDTPSTELVLVLEKLRTELGKPIGITFNGGCRCATHNKSVGGVAKSQHILGTAADIKVAGLSPHIVSIAANKVLESGGGIGVYNTFTHIDVRPIRARW